MSGRGAPKKPNISLSFSQPSRCDFFFPYATPLAQCNIPELIKSLLQETEAPLEDQLRTFPHIFSTPMPYRPRLHAVFTRETFLEEVSDAESGERERQLRMIFENRLQAPKIED